MTPYIDDSDFRLYVGDVREVLAKLPAASIDCCVTSPPYWGLRDYGADGQIGLEASPELFVAEMVAVFREVGRVLSDTGTVWLNLGDSYVSTAGSLRTISDGGKNYDELNADGAGGRLLNSERQRFGKAERGDLKPKDLVGIPWRVAFALQEDGWYLRSDIIWSKPNTMPSSVTDRPTTAHEYVFLLSKQRRYFFDQEAVRVPYQWDGRMKTSVKGGPGSLQHRDGERWPGIGKTHHEARGQMTAHGHDESEPMEVNHAGRNIRTVWEIPTASYSEAHFATFPEKLPELCIKAGCPEQVCATCGKPRERELERKFYGNLRTEDNLDGAKDDVTGITRNNFGGQKKNAEYVPPKMVGWTDCGCAYGLEPDALEMIATPTGVREGDDPSLVTGRAGMNRPRGDNEGRRPITRYEQRRYAEQLKASPARERLEAEAGPAFAHYVRTDTSGARPVPDELLERWIADGLIERVDLPPRSGTNYRPGVVLDPFMGSGTTALVARRLGRHAVGIELSAEYAKICASRLQQLSLLA